MTTMPLDVSIPQFTAWLSSPLGWAALSREARVHQPGSRSLETTLSATKLLAAAAVELGKAESLCLSWCINKNQLWPVLEHCRKRTRTHHGRTAQVGDARFYQMIQAALKVLEFVTSVEPALVNAGSVTCKERLRIALHQVRRSAAPAM